MVSNVSIKPNKKPRSQKQKKHADKKSDFFCHIKVLKDQIFYAIAPQ